MEIRRARGSKREIESDQVLVRCFGVMVTCYAFPRMEAEEIIRFGVIDWNLDGMKTKKR